MFTQNQLNAIQNMEKFCGINSHRTSFESKKEFQKYFELLQARCNKKAKLYDNIKSGKTSYEEINNYKKQKKDKYFNDPNNLFNYGINYISRYFPTKEKLKSKLIEKSKNHDLSLLVFDKLKSMIDEEKMIDFQIKDFLSRGKNVNYIYKKLREKRFEKELIIVKINDLKSGESLLDKNIIYQKVMNLKNRGKSKLEIIQRLVERQEDKSVVNEAIEEVFGDGGEQQILAKEVQKLKAKKTSDNKIIERLGRKGFNYYDIKEVLEEKNL